MRPVFYFFLCFSLLQACSGIRNAESFEADEFEALDTLVVTASRDRPSKDRKIFHPSKEKKLDLKHIELDLSFDWKNRSVIGRATLRLTPYFYPQNKVILDAKKMDILSVKLNSTNTKYEYDGQFLAATLDREYNRGEEFVLEIEYRTSSWKNMETSAPFKDNMGAYFIAADPIDRFHSAQIWTQGETEYNSRWFPCIDQPNERMTQEIRLTVKNDYSTLSNGILTEQIPLKNGYRTDVWVLDIPHPVYLAAFAVGEFFIHSEMVNGLLYQYYVDSAYAENAAAIYAHTPEMVQFFSGFTGVDFPWPKYGQVAVKNFVAGAMENTSATIFGDFIQKSTQELYDEPNDAIVAHELFHQWFGNYITCESWANLTLNEGFASYGEYLWAEHKYGYLEAEETRYGFLMNYLFSSMSQVHPLIYYQYDDPEAMFDPHSYDKGALSLHLLRQYLGEEAFFEGIKKYIQSNALSEVEFDELRLAFEDVSGKDLQAFFDQWFSASGHPEWTVVLKPGKDSLFIDLHQDQYSDKGFRLFGWPLEFVVFDTTGREHKYEFHVSKEYEHYSVPLKERYLFAQVDPEMKIMGRLFVNYSLKDFRHIYLNASHPIARFEAFKSLLPEIPKDSVLQKAALEDPYYRIRAIAVDKIESPRNNLMEKIKRLALEDPHPLVRKSAINKIGGMADESWLKALAANMLKEPSQMVLLASFDVLSERNPSLTVAPALKHLYQLSYPLQEASFRALKNNQSGSFFPLMEKALLERHGIVLDTLLKEYVLMAGELGEEGRIHARSWIGSQLKNKRKNDPDYKTLIKYKQSLL